MAGSLRALVACQPKLRRSEGWRPGLESNQAGKPCMAFASPIRHRAAAADKGAGLTGGIWLQPFKIRLNRRLLACDPREEGHAPLIVADIARRARRLKTGGLEPRQHRRFFIARKTGRPAQLQVIRKNDADQPEERGGKKAVARAETQQRERRRRCR